jgi:small GTP-binding protein
MNTAPAPCDAASASTSPGSLAEEYRLALRTVEEALGRIRGGTDEERAQLRSEAAGLAQMLGKLLAGRLDIVLLGEISTGKSALINALVGRPVAEVDVRGGWTRQVREVPWEGTSYAVPGLDRSQVVLIDTPGLNEVGGELRETMARQAAQRADLVLFVIKSDLNETEYQALLALAALHKPLLVVLNKIDLYTPPQRERLLTVLRQERLRDLVPPEHVVPAAADPMERECIVQSPDGRERIERRKMPPDVAELKARILEVLDREGPALLALNAALYSAESDDRIATLRVTLRENRAQQVVWSYATLKGIAVALNPLPVVDVLGGSAMDVAMVGTLGAIYGLPLRRAAAAQLVASLATAASLTTAGIVASWGLSWGVSLLKGLSLGKTTLLTAAPQALSAAFGSYIVGQAARYYFQHGGSWGGQTPRAVVRQILAKTDRQSVYDHLRQAIQERLTLPSHGRPGK